jgi:hypothetical protein
VPPDTERETAEIQTDQRQADQVDGSEPELDPDPEAEPPDPDIIAGRQPPTSEANGAGPDPFGPDPAGSGGEERRSLLGTYPIPSPHLVGTPVPRSPGHPSQWRAPLPPLQYGIDYTFLRLNGRQPILWQPDWPITVRFCEPHGPEQATSLAAVVAQLAQLTGLSLVTGAPWSRLINTKAVPAQEIHVGFARTLPTAPFVRPCAGRVGVGGAIAAQNGTRFTSGFAVIADSDAGSSSMWDVAVLRHELAHALGLGHAARPNLLMYHRISKTAVEFGRGDRHGLKLLNENAHLSAPS